MYEETQSKIDWKGIFLKVIIAFLVVLIAIKGYSTLKGNNNEKKTTTETTATAESKSSSTFTANIEKLRAAGEKYFTENKDKLPTKEGNTTMVTLNELVSNGVIENLSDADGKTCDGESSYVNAILDGTKTKIKANLVCGNASSYSLVYMGENDNELDNTSNSNTNVASSSNYTTSKNNTSSQKSNNTNCGSSSCGNVKISNNVSQKVVLNGKTSRNKNTSSNSNNSSNRNTTRKYTVKFDSNGGYDIYSSQRVYENQTAYNPGSVSKNGYTFDGWYLNGYKYNFSTPVTENITLTAKFTRNNTYYDDDYDNNYNNRYHYSNRNNRKTLKTATYTQTVYTMGWENKGSDYISIDHILRLPSYLSRDNIEEVKINDIYFYKSINTAKLANDYRVKRNDTFFYRNNGWEATRYDGDSLATISKNAVRFSYDTSYKSAYAARRGFDVNWTANYVDYQCVRPFTVNGEENKCNYGIIYKVEWLYTYYD